MVLPRLAARLIPSCALRRPLTAVLLLIVSTAGAQSLPPPPRPVSLVQALELARAHYPRLQAKTAQVQAAQAEIQQVRTQRLPSVRLSQQVSYGTINGAAGTILPYGTVIPTTGGAAAANSSDAVFGSVSTAYAEWSPVTFGQYGAQLDRARATAEYAVADADNEWFGQQVRVAQTYLELLAVQNLRAVRQKNLSRVLTLKKTITRLTLNGLRPGVDSTQAAAEVSQARLSLVEARELEAERQTRLSTLLGQPGQRWQPDTTFNRHLPAADMAALAPAEHPALRLQQRAIGLNQARETILRRSYRPRLALLGGTWGRGTGVGADGRYDYGVTGAAPTRFNYAVGVGLVFDLLDLPRLRAQGRAEGFRTQALQQDLRQQQLELSNQQLLAAERIGLAAERVRESPVQLAAAAQAYRQKLALYHAGLATITDLTQALYNLQKAEQDQALTVNNAWQALLLQAAGTGDFSLFQTRLNP